MRMDLVKKDPPCGQGVGGCPMCRTYTSEPTSCKTETASICSTTTSFRIFVSSTATITTTTQISSVCSTGAGSDTEDRSATATQTGTCTTSTVTDVWVSCSATATADCQTASTSLITGCGVTATTQSCTVATATATGLTGLTGRAEPPSLPACNFGPVKYVVYPKDGTDTAQTAQIYAELLKYSAAADIYQSNTNTIGVNFWLLSITDDQGINLATQLAGIAAAVYSQSPVESYFDPTTTVDYQPGAPDDLVFVSQQDNIPLGTYSRNYYFDDTATPGQDVPVYILDTGAYEPHTEFDLVRRSMRWILVGQDYDQTTGQMVDPAQDDSQTDPLNQIYIGKAHGTAMLSLVTGQNLGVAKRVKPIIVRVPRRTIAQSSLGGATFEEYIEGLGKICDDLNAHHEWQRCVSGFAGRMQALLVNIVSKGILPITGTGNTQSSTIDAWPANFGGVSPGAPAAIPELLVVGGLFVQPTTNNDNSQNGGRTYAYDPSKSLPHVYAPAVLVTAAQGNQGGLPITKTSSGTSDASALTAGLAAYYLKLAQAGVFNFAQTALGLKTFIISKTWERQPGVPAIWNGAIPASDSCAWTPPAPAKRDHTVRQADASCGIPLSLSSAIASATNTGTTAITTTAITTTAATTTNPSSTLTTVVCNSATLVPGQCGVPGCAYVLAADLGSGALCPADYCNCGGTLVPLLTQTISGTTSEDCGYTTQPATDNCPAATGTTATTAITTQVAPTTTTAQATPTSPLTVGTQQCNNGADFPGHGDIEYGFLSEYIGWACTGSALDESIISASNNPMEPFHTQTNGVYYYLSITWVEGCVTTVNSQSPWQPIPDNSDVTCFTLFDGDYYNCDNSGVGGSIQVGCLKYLFSPSEDGTTI